MTIENAVTLLGTKGGPAIRPGSTMPTSSLVQLGGQTIVVDCGLGVSRALTNQGMQLSNLSVIFITHMHSDHFIELGPLMHTAWMAGLKTVVEIWGPKGLEDYWNGFLQSMKADIELRIEDEGRIPIMDLVRIHVLDEGEFYNRDGLAVSALRNVHPPFVDTFALSFRSTHHHVVFSGDTAYHPPLIEFAKDADLLIHEAMLEAALEPLMARIGNADDRLMKHWLRSHTFAHDAAGLAQEAGVKRLAFHHLIPSDDQDFNEQHWLDAVQPHYNGEFILGQDGLKIPL